MELQERIKLDKKEKNKLVRSYIKYIIEGISNGYFNKGEIYELISKLHDYKFELKTELSYLKYLLKNIDNIDEQELDRIINLINESNDSTYFYYDAIGDAYAASSYISGCMHDISRKVPSITHNKKLTDEIKGITLNQQDIFDYYEDNKDAIEYLQERSKIYDYEDKYKFLYGVYPIEDEEGNLERIGIIAPSVKNLETALINIREYRHGIDLYNYIGKRYPDMNFQERAEREQKAFIKNYVRNK